MSEGEGEDIKQRILELVKDYYGLKHAEKVFEPGETKINYSCRLFDEKEMQNLVDSALDFWLTAGPYSRKFETRVRDFFGAKASLMVNSGSSANLLMVSALASSQYSEHLKPGDEIITPAVTFPTTLAPIIQNQFTPVFVDCQIGTYNIDSNLIEGAISPKTRAIFIPHTLGNPCDMDKIAEIIERHNLVLIEDCCDTLGTTYNNKEVGTFGKMASLSFYPPHHITTGEGGCVVINDAKFIRIIRSLRDWGRDCYCEPGQSNACGKRFSGQYGSLPFGYDHKYVYSNIGYNLKATDMQAAIGLAQMDKIKPFIEARRNNFSYFYKHLKKFEDHLILPKWNKKANPSWFAFPITVKEDVDPNKLIGFLESANIETRKVFAGNILKHPGFKDIKHRIYGELTNSDTIMNRSFFVGVHPGLTEQMKKFVVSRFEQYFSEQN
ncbi:lipopolysaccharide biosynthesis protein RfbH [Candidatus Woesearchaeota archaeon]|nr:lipopolysaccharide biosynthesis protein RfbH [Candidatus Woesearchaeota archaeon]